MLSFISQVLCLFLGLLFLAEFVIIADTWMRKGTEEIFMVDVVSPLLKIATYVSRKYFSMLYLLTTCLLDILFCFFIFAATLDLVHLRREATKESVVGHPLDFLVFYAGSKRVRRSHSHHSSCSKCKKISPPCIFYNLVALDISLRRSYNSELKSYPVNHSFNQSINQSIGQSIDQSINQSIDYFVKLHLTSFPFLQGLPEGYVFIIRNVAFPIIVAQFILAFFAERFPVVTGDGSVRDELK